MGDNNICSVVSAMNRPKRMENKLPNATRYLVELLGRCLSYFKLNILASVYIQSDCLWAYSRDNSSNALSYYFQKIGQY